MSMRDISLLLCLPVFALGQAGGDLNKSKRFAVEILLLRAMFTLAPPLKNTSGHPLNPEEGKQKLLIRDPIRQLTGACIPI